MDKIIDIKQVSKIYKLYERPIERMYEALSLSKKKRHSNHYALKNVTFSIDKGEIVGFIGKNGAGKSTMLKIITGLLTESEGSVCVNGTISALLELGTGFNPEYSGIENIFLYGTMLGKTHEEVEKDVPSVVEFADIGDFIHQPVKTYSSGMFARLAFSVAINVKPDILIVDEILAVGDLDFQLKCMNKMKEMMRGGTTVLFVSHDINSIKRFCTRAIWLKKGELMEDGNVNVVTDHFLDYLKLESKDKGLAESMFAKDKLQELDNVDLEMKVVQANLEENAKELEGSSEGDYFKAEVKRFRILNKFGEDITVFNKDEKLYLSLEYIVNDISIEKAVVGICIRRIDDEYMCGYNTLLDHVEIPWKKGYNRIVLEYTYGCLLMGGRYYFDAALFEETATIPIQYVSKIKEFEVQNDYIAEGIFAMPHKWNCEG